MAAEKNGIKKPKDTTVASESKAGTKNWKPTPFVLENERLPANYAGLDPIKFFKMFKSKVALIKKGEYETTEEFIQRTANKDAILSPINTVDLYAFRMLSDISIKYKADEQAYLIGGPYDYYCEKTDSFGRSSGWVTCTVASISEKHDTYIGSNAFGVSRSIKRKRGHNFSLAIHEDSPLLNTVFSKNQYQNSIYNYQTKVEVPLEKARELKNEKVGILFVGRVRDAKLIEGVPFIREPEIGSLKDIFIKEEAVPFEIKKIIYYVIRTGEIIGQTNYELIPLS